MKSGVEEKKSETGPLSMGQRNSSRGGPPRCTETATSISSARLIYVHILVSVRVAALLD